MKTGRFNGGTWVLSAVLITAAAPQLAAQALPPGVPASSSETAKNLDVGEGSVAVTATAEPDQRSGNKDSIELPPIEVGGDNAPMPKTRLSPDPVSNPASVTVFDYPDAKKRSIRDNADLLKPVTGVQSNNFDQGGVGFGFTLRGFSQRSNGSNAAVVIDGVPVNQTSHTLSNGYADLTPLIPELVQQFVLTRGPFDVRAGANALGGSLQIVTHDQPSPGAALSGGRFGYGRAFAAYGSGSGAVAGYGSLMVSTTSGYRDNADLDQINTFNKILFPLFDGAGSVRLQIFSDDYGAPGFINREAVKNGTLSPRAAVNPTDGGNTDLQNIVFSYRQDGDEPLTASVYLQNSALDRFSSRFTTTPFNPDGPGQIQQVDDRLVFGAALDQYSRLEFGSGTGLDWFVGGGVRTDWVDSERYNTIRRAQTAQTENTDFTLTNPFVYGQLNYKPAVWIKLTGGLRYDHLFYDIEDRTRGREVSTDLGTFQPKAGLSVSPIEGLDFFANYGKGFRTPSAIAGGTLSTPAELVADPDADVAEIDTRELGVQYGSADGTWYFLLNGYRTNFTNELQGRPAPLPPLALGPSRRNGYDVETRVRAYQEGKRRLSLFASYSRVDGELVGRSSPGTAIPDVPEFLIKYGFDLTMTLGGLDSPHTFTWLAAQLWEGPKPLNPTRSFETKSYSRYDTTLAYANDHWKGFSAFLGAIIYPDRRLEETAFLFGNPPAVGVSPKAPVTLQAGVFVPF